MTGSDLMVEGPFEQARRILGIGVQEAIAYAKAQNLEMAVIKKAALDVGALMLKFGTPPSSPKFKVFRGDEIQGRLPFRDEEEP